MHRQTTGPQLPYTSQRPSHIYSQSSTSRRKQIDNEFQAAILPAYPEKYISANACHTNWSQPKLQIPSFQHPSLPAQGFRYDHCLQEFSPYMMQSSRCLCYYCTQPEHRPVTTRCFTQPESLKQQQQQAWEEAMQDSNLERVKRKRDQKLQSKLVLKRQGTMSSISQKTKSNWSETRANPRTSTINDQTETGSLTLKFSGASVVSKLTKTNEQSNSDNLSSTQYHEIICQKPDYVYKPLHQFLQHFKVTFQGTWDTPKHCNTKRIKQLCDNIFTPPSLNTIITPPSLKKQFQNSVPEKSTKPQSARLRVESERVKVFPGEFDYDHNLSRLAYTNYQDPTKLKGRVLIKFVEPVRLSQHRPKNH